MTHPVMAVAEAAPEERQAWDAFVAATVSADHLQAWGWGEVTARSGERPVRLAVRGPGGDVRGIAQVLVREAALGRRVLYVPHGPVWDDAAPDAPTVLRALLGAIRAAGRRERGIVAKLDPRADGEGTDAVRKALLAHGLRPARADLQARTTRILDLRQGAEALFASVKPDARRLVRRAAREGVTTCVVRDADPGAYAEFARLLAATGQRGGFRVRSAAALQRLAEELSPLGGTRLVLAELGGRAISGYLTTVVGDRAFQVYAGSLREPELRHAYGAYAGLWTTCETLAADGVATLDLWGVAEPDDQMADASWRGFSDFKLAFGGTPLRHPGTFDLVLSTGWYAVRDLWERAARRHGDGRRPERRAL